MAETTQPLQKPPGYRNPTDPVPPPPKTRKAYVPPPYKPKPKSRNCCRCCCCFFCTLFFLILFLLAIVSVLFYLWFEPKIPNFHLFALKFDRFNVTVKRDGTYLDSGTTIKFQIVNPNSKIKVNYGPTQVRLSLAGDDLDGFDFGSATLPEFTQKAKNTTILKIETNVKNALIDDDVGKKLQSKFRSKAIVVNSEVQTKVGVGVLNWNVHKLPVKVLCDGVSLKDVEGGHSPKCVINLLKWINIH